MKNFRIQIRWRAFPLHPDTPEDGITLEELFAGRNADIPSVLSRLERVAKELGLPWGERKITYNSRLAQELGKWAETQGRGDDFHNAVFRSYFVDGRNIAKKEVLIDLAAGAGLPKGGAQKTLESRSFKSSVDEDWRLSSKWGITAVPTFVVDRAVLVGAHPYEKLAQFLINQGVRKKETMPPLR